MVKRYTVNNGKPTEWADGEYVRHSDYAALERERDHYARLYEIARTCPYCEDVMPSGSSCCCGWIPNINTGAGTPIGDSLRSQRDMLVEALGHAIDAWDYDETDARWVEIARASLAKMRERGGGATICPKRNKKEARP